MEPQYLAARIVEQRTVDNKHVWYHYANTKGMVFDFVFERRKAQLAGYPVDTERNRGNFEKLLLDFQGEPKYPQTYGECLERLCVMHRYVEVAGYNTNKEAKMLLTQLEDDT